MTGKHYGLIGDEYVQPPRIQDSLAALLGALGFTAMAEEVLSEGDTGRLRQYARVIAKNMPDSDKRKSTVVNSLRMLRLL